MNWFRLCCSGLVLLICPLSARAQAPVTQAGIDEPLLRLEPGGPTSYVTSLVLSPEGRSLYEAGWDKVVRVWSRGGERGGFSLDPSATYRVPIGPGTGGVINALAISPDGRWLAAAGMGVVRSSAGFRQNGIVVPNLVMSDDMRWDQGVIYVFDTHSNPRTARLLRGHQGPVLALAFAPARAGKPPLLVSAAQERDTVGTVRLWDAASGDYLGGLSGLPAATTRPGLAAWHTGEGRTQIRVAIAWGDGRLRTWDPTLSSIQAASFTEGRFNQTVVYLPDQNRLLTGSLGREHGQLALWDLPADASVAPRQAGPPFPLIPAGLGSGQRAEYLPQAIVPTSSHTQGARFDLAAVVLLKVPDRSMGSIPDWEYTLQLVDLDEKRFGRVKAVAPLWTSADRMLPALGANPTGGKLAVGGNRQGEVLVFVVSDLLAGRVNPQRLHGAGVTMRRVAFATRGSEWGLALSPARKPQPGAPAQRLSSDDVIFDFKNRRLTGNSRGWSIEGPKPGGWQARALREVDAPGRETWSIGVRSPAGREQIVPLKGQGIPTDFALLPPQGTGAAPILAVASHAHGEPMLILYNGTTGEAVRQLTGHVERIGALAFSADGRLLASVAEDRTVCVWSLVDLDKTIRSLRLLKDGTAVVSEGALVVMGVDAARQTRPGSLHNGDRIQGLWQDGRLRPFHSLQDYLAALAHVAAGRTVTLVCSAPGQAARRVTVEVVQGTDERKPLFSLFLDKREEDWSWVGWNPFGPYESSDRSMERLLGWHFNTGQPESPTRFAVVDQYRRFYREGLLQELVTRGTLPPVAVAPPLPRPQMALVFEPGQAADGRDQILVHEPPSAVSLVVVDRRIPADGIDSVRWQLDDGSLKEMRPKAEGVWAAPIPKEGWIPGIHRVRAVVRTRENAPQEFSETRLVRMQSPPPLVTTSLADEKPVVTKPDFRFQADVEPQSKSATVELTHRSSKGLKRVGEWTRAEGLVRIDKTIVLEPGANTIELVARNDNALSGFEDQETTRIPGIHVVYRRQPAPAPEIRLEGLLVASGAAEPGRPLPIVRRDVNVVHAPRLLVVGQIAAKEKLNLAEWVEEGSDQPHPLALFEPGKQSTFSIKEPLTLTPGSHTLHFRARAGDSEAGVAPVMIDYQPEVPIVQDVALNPPGPVLYQGHDSRQVQLACRLVAPVDLQPYQAVVLVNNEEQPGDVEEKAGTLQASVKLGPGDNKIQVRLTNRWHAAWTSDPVVLSYRRPPVVRSVARPTVGDRPLINVSATVESAEDLPLLRAQIRVQGHDGSWSRHIDDPQFRREGKAWLISGHDVPIQPGENVIEVLAWNADGPCLAAGRCEGLVYRAPPPPRPEVALIRPAQDGKVSTRKLSVEFLVRSTSPLKKLQLIRVRAGAGSEILHAVDIASLKPGGDGQVEARATQEVTLEQGTNNLQVIAVNAGGDGIAQANVTYVPPPVRVVIDRIESRSRPEGVVASQVQENNRVVFTQPLGSGIAWVHGRIVLPDKTTWHVDETSRVQVFVNGLRQADSPLTAGDPRGLEFRFRARLLLSREENHVAIRVRDLPRQADDSFEFALRCGHPESDQRMHLLIVGVGEDDELRLRDRALQALQATVVSGSPREFSTPAFSRGYLYKPLCGDVREWDLFGQIALIKDAINPSRDLADRPDEVVVVYYQGNESISQGKPYLQLRSRRSRGGAEGIFVDDLIAAFSETLGVQIFLLDVTHDGARTAPLRMAGVTGDDGSRVSLLRSAWLGRAAAGATPAPEDARLITTLRQTLPHASTLGQVVAEISRTYTQLRKRYPTLSYDQELPDSLSDLVIGRP